MNICGVIAEYNPFHNGHRHHLAEARRLSGCDYLIVVMGGAFSQRGEVMLLDKWTRTRMALLNGADLVVELPALFAVRSADAFAWGGVSILSGLCADSICFGCETDDLFLLNRMLDALDDESKELADGIRRRLDAGQSHVRARGEALSELLELPQEIAAGPNAALALEYLRANRRMSRPMQPHVVLRRGGYHDSAVTPLASASAIRSAIARGEADLVASAMPGSAYDLLLSSLPGRAADMTRLDSLIVDRLRSLSAEEIARLPNVGEGLERRVQKCAEEAGSRDALLSALKCKRYTHARLSRLLAHAALGVTSELTKKFPSPTYARVLGFRKDASALLTQLASAKLPLVTRASLLREDEIFRLERRATDLQSLCFPDESARRAGRDLTEKMIVFS